MVPWNSNLEKCRNWFLAICMYNVLIQNPKTVSYLRPGKSQKTRISQIPRFNPLKWTLFAPWNSNFENAGMVFRYLCEVCFSTIPKRYLILRPTKSQKHKCHRYPLLTLYVPWNSNLEKCRNLFLGICMKNVLVQFRKWYLILWPRKCTKHESRRYPRFTPLCHLKFEFRKMQKLVFRYLYEEYFSATSKTISYFAVEKI